MIITAANKDSAILNDIVSVLSTIKDGSKANKPLVIGKGSGFSSVTVEFYTDAERTNLLFSKNTIEDVEYFTFLPGDKLAFTPTDAIINGSGAGMAQGAYWVTITIINDEYDVQTSESTYRNAENLLFSGVIVATAKNPPKLTADNVCIVVPGEQKLDNRKASGDLGYLLLPFDLYVQLNVFNWKNLSEQERVIAANNVNNLVRLALYQDRYRNGHCTLKDEDIDGTYVGQISLLPSTDTLKGVIKITCASLANKSSY